MLSVHLYFRHMFPGGRMAHGAPRHSEPQGQIEADNKTAQQILRKWCFDHNTHKWWLGIPQLIWTRRCNVPRSTHVAPLEYLTGT